MKRMPIRLKSEKKRAGASKTSRYRKQGYYRISDLTCDFNITPRALHVYEKIGILNPLREGNHRYYDRNDYDRLQVLLMAKSLDLRLEDIAKIFADGNEITLSQIINLLSSKQLLVQREHIVRQRQRMDVVMAEINAALREREERFISAGQTCDT